MDDRQALRQPDTTFHVVRGDVSQREKPQLLQNAVKLVQKVTLGGKYAVAGQGFEFPAKTATAGKGIKLIATVIRPEQFIKGQKQGVLVIMSNP